MCQVEVGIERQPMELQADLKKGAHCANRVWRDLCAQANGRQSMCSEGQHAIGALRAGEPSVAWQCVLAGCGEAVYGGRVYKE